MIRINLLSVDRERTKRAALIPPGQRVTLAASLIVIATFLFVGWWFWSLYQASVRVDEDLAKGEREMQQLRSVLAQVQKWDDIVLAGMTTSFTGLSDFVANLESSTWFKKPIDIVDSQVMTDAKSGDIFKFSVKAVFNNPEAPPPPPAPAAGRGRGIPAKKAGS
jgi:hypothetical protein